jgi:hypothetical protein
MERHRNRSLQQKASDKPPVPWNGTATGIRLNFREIFLLFLYFIENLSFTVAIIPTAKYLTKCIY